MIENKNGNLTFDVSLKKVQSNGKRVPGYKAAILTQNAKCKGKHHSNLI